MVRFLLTSVRTRMEIVKKALGMIAEKNPRQINTDFTKRLKNIIVKSTEDPSPSAAREVRSTVDPVSTSSNATTAMNNFFEKKFSSCISL